MMTRRSNRLVVTTNTNSLRNDSSKASPRKQRQRTSRGRQHVDVDNDNDGAANSSHHNLHSTSTSTSTSRRHSPKEEEKEEALSEDIASSKSDEQDDEEEELEKSQDAQTRVVYVLDGVTYATYQEFVHAKRRRNQQRLVDSGLLQAVEIVRHESSSITEKKKITKRKIDTTTTTAGSNSAVAEPPRRKSNRLAGIAAQGGFVEKERAGKFEIVQGSIESENSRLVVEAAPEAKGEFYNSRINDGSDISIRQAVENCEAQKWLAQEEDENGVSAAADAAVAFCRNMQGLSEDGHDDANKDQDKDRHPVATVTNNRLAFSTKEILSLQIPVVTKVVPDRIYGMAMHPRRDKCFVAAGDKRGYVGLWDATGSITSLSSNSLSVGDNSTTNDAKTHLFKYHTGSAVSLQFNRSGTALFSCSYDGTCRWFDLEKECIAETFAVFSSEEQEFQSRAGFDTCSDGAWTQFACLDIRNPESSFFVSTSEGNVFHVDKRNKPNEQVTFFESLSDKKINTVSLHPDGYSMVTAGLDCCVSLWDVRKCGDSRKRKDKQQPITQHLNGLSVNSAFTSPSGRYVVSTSMSNKLFLYENFHLSTVRPVAVQEIPHDNRTGRWLSTFQAIWHDTMDTFAVGSMRKPRAVDLWTSVAAPSASTTGTGGSHDDSKDQSLSSQILSVTGEEMLTSVASRLCFHPRSDQLILAGGNSSGRVTIIHS